MTDPSLDSPWPTPTLCCLLVMARQVPLAGEHPGLVHQPSAVVGPPHPRLLRHQEDGGGPPPPQRPGREDKQASKQTADRKPDRLRSVTWLTRREAHQDTRGLRTTGWLVADMGACVCGVRRTTTGGWWRGRRRSPGPRPPSCSASRRTRSAPHQQSAGSSMGREGAPAVRQGRQAGLTHTCPLVRVVVDR